MAGDDEYKWESAGGDEYESKSAGGGKYKWESVSEGGDEYESESSSVVDHTEYDDLQALEALLNAGYVNIITLTCACTNTQLTNGHSITNTMQLTCMYM